MHLQQQQTSAQNNALENQTLPVASTPTNEFRITGLDQQRASQSLLELDINQECDSEYDSKYLEEIMRNFEEAKIENSVTGQIIEQPDNELIEATYSFAEVPPQSKEFKKALSCAPGFNTGKVSPYLATYRRLLD